MEYKVSLTTTQELVVEAATREEAADKALEKAWFDVEPDWYVTGIKEV